MLAALDESEVAVGATASANQTLTVTVPAGIPVGPCTLRVVRGDLSAEADYAAVSNIVVTAGNEWACYVVDVSGLDNPREAPRLLPMTFFHCPWVTSLLPRQYARPIVTGCRVSWSRRPGSEGGEPIMNVPGWIKTISIPTVLLAVSPEGRCDANPLATSVETARRAPLSADLDSVPRDAQCGSTLSIG